MTATAQEQSLEVLMKQAAETYAGSVLFMKQLTTIAISTITYIKNVFEEENFKSEHINGVRMKILKKDCKDELAQFVSTALMQAFDAFDKKYLHKLALCFYEEEACDAENLVEYLVFEYSYTQTGVRMDVSSKSRASAKSQYTFEHVRDTMIQMIRTCVMMMETQVQLPEIYDISLRLYYNDGAPEGYQPPGFLPVSEIDDHLEISQSKNGRPVQMGCVQTPFHRFVAHSFARQAIPSSNDAEPSQNAPMMTQMDEFDSKLFDLFTLEPLKDKAAATGHPQYIDGSKTNVSEQDSEGQAASSAGRGTVRCPCLKEDDDGLMLTCDICGFLQHGACFGRVRTPRRHACAHCGPAPGSDARLLAINDRKRESLCVLRRSLSYCARRASVDLGALRDQFLISQEKAAKLVRQLITLGVLENSEQGIMESRKIVREQLKAQMGKLFYLEESELVDRLEAEGLSVPAPAQRDPVGAVLGRMERASLQEATVLGKMIEPPKQKVVEDKTLQQYKEAILSSQNMEEDLPLSGNHNPVKDMNLIGTKSRKRHSGKENTAGVKTKRVKAK